MAESNAALLGMNALVTGASSGLGPHICKALDDAGARVAIVYGSNREGAESLAKQCANSPVVLQADITDPASMQRLFADARNALGEVTILVNCAAVESQDVSDIADIGLDRWSSTQRANVDTPMELTRLFAAQGMAGAVINISSIEASRPAAGHGHYSTSKAALEMLTRATALEFGGLGVRVNAIAPGLIMREGIEEAWPEGVAAWNTAAPLGRLVDPANVADTVVFLASPSTASITGSIITIDCGLSVKSGW